MMVLTESAAPTSIRASMASRKLRARPKKIVAHAKDHHRAEEDRPLAADVLDLRDDQGSGNRADRLRRREPAVLHRAHMQDVAGEDGHERVGRGEEGGEEIQHHGGEDDRAG